MLHQPGMVRAGVESHELKSFEIQQLNFEAAAVCEIDVVLSIAGSARDARMRWIREGSDGMAALPSRDGEWRLINWGPVAMIDRAETSD